LKEPVNNENSGHCRNCNSSIGQAKYCSNCGQRNRDGRLSFVEFILVVFNTVFNLESKFFLTIRDIFIPGKLTSEWVRGKQKRYFHPVRLFIVTALLLIAVLSLFINENNSFQTGDYEEVKQEISRKKFIKEIDNYSVLYIKDNEAKIVLDSLSETMRKGKVTSGKNMLVKYGKKNNLSDLEDRSIEEIIVLFQNELGAETTDSIINVIISKRQINQDSIQLNNLIGDTRKQNLSNEDFLNLSPSEIADKYQVEGFFNRLHFKQRIRLQKSGKDLLPFFLGNSLWVALLMMPFLAFILKLMYIRHDYYFLEHLVFSFHAHSFAFILFSIIGIVLKVVYMHPLIIFCGFLLLFIYLYKSLRKVYQQGRLKTLLKLLISNIFYVGLFFLFALLGLISSLFLF